VNTIRLSPTIDKLTAINLIVGMTLWLSWSVLVVQLHAVTVHLSYAQLYSLLAAAGSGACVFQFVFLWLGERSMHKRFIQVGSVLLLIPAIGLTWQLSVAEIAIEQLYVLAFLSGLGGAQFIALQPAAGARIEKSSLGWVLAVNAGIGGVGIVLAQTLLPLLSGINWLGDWAASPWFTHQTSGDIVGVLPPSTPLWLANTGWLLVVAVIATSLYSLGQRRARGAQAMPSPSGHPPSAEPVVTNTQPPMLGRILKNRHTWLMTLFYVMAFGSFIGFAMTLPLSLETFSANYTPSALTYAWIGPLLGVLARPFGGWLADQYGGAKVLVVCALVMAMACLSAAYMTAAALQSRVPEEWFLPYLLVFLVIFIAAGAASSAVFKTASVVLPLEQLPLALRWLTAVATAGAIYIPALWYINLSQAHGANTLVAFALFYVLCAALVSWMYLRRRSEFYNP